MSTNFSIPNTISDRIVSSMENAIVGYFISFHPMVDMVKRWVVAKWHIKGSVAICAMVGGLLLLKFTTLEDLISILSLGPWVYGKHSLALCRLKLVFELVVDLNKSTLVWVHLNSIPLEY